MSWKLWAAASAAALLIGPSARAGDLFQMAIPASDAPAQTRAVVYPGRFWGGGFGPSWGGYPSYRAPYRFFPQYDLNFGFGFPPPSFYNAPLPYFFPAPPVYSYTTPSGLGVTTYSLPAGEVTYSVTQPPPLGPEQLPPPVPRNATFPYDGGPPNPVPMPHVEPDPTSLPHYFHIAPRDDVRVSFPAKPAKGKFSYPAYGEQPRRTAGDRTIVIKDVKKTGR